MKMYPGVGACDQQLLAEVSHLVDVAHAPLIDPAQNLHCTSDTVNIIDGNSKPGVAAVAVVAVMVKRGEALAKRCGNNGDGERPARYETARECQASAAARC